MLQVVSGLCVLLTITSFTFYSVAETLSEDEDDGIMVPGEGVSISATPSFTSSSSEFTPTPGGPFSALTPSMWPQDILSRLGNPVSKQCLLTAILVSFGLHHFF